MHFISPMFNMQTSNTRTDFDYSTRLIFIQLLNQLLKNKTKLNVHPIPLNTHTHMHTHPPQHKERPVFGSHPYREPGARGRMSAERKSYH